MVEYLPARQMVVGSIPIVRSKQTACSLKEKPSAHNRSDVGSRPTAPTNFRLRSGEHAGFIRRLAQIDTGASDHDAVVEQSGSSSASYAAAQGAKA